MNSKRSSIIRWVVISAIILVGLAVLGWRISLGLSNQARASEPAYWPTEGWQESTPEEQGIYSNKLADGLLAIRTKNINIHSLLIIRNGYVVADATFYPYDGQTIHDVASVTKSVMTTLIGIAADQGKLTLDDRMTSFFPNY
ncbi:MAG TPA: serine hydrolase, partial [Anaerolineales bacterium]